jgi:hypothetical protein
MSAFVQITTQHNAPLWIHKSTIKSIEPPSLSYGMKYGFPTVGMHDPRFTITHRNGRHLGRSKVWFQDLAEAGIKVTAPGDILYGALLHVFEEHARIRAASVAVAMPAPAEAA